MAADLILRTADPVLAKLAIARGQLAKAKDLQAVKQIADAAKAAKVYAQQQQLGDEAIGYAHAVRCEAMRRLGELQKDRPKQHGARGTGKKVELQTGTPLPPTNTELGITKRLSHEAQLLAALPPKKFAALVERQTTFHHVTRDLRRASRVARVAATVMKNQPLDGAQPVPVIYADPPWQYEHVATESRAIENQYPTLTLEAICALPVSAAATADAVLFLWATSPKLAEAMRVIDAWGFVYRTCMVWVKDKIGMGYYCRQQHELLLIAARGSLPAPADAARPASVITAPRGKHSAKPEIFYELIERMYPEFPRRELFARQQRAGWLAWGNEAGR